MRVVRRHRRLIMIVLGLFALGAMTLGYLKRIGIDPLEKPDRAEQSAPAR